MVVLHQFEEFGGRFAALGEVMGEVNERKCRNGNEICQAAKGADAGLFDGESAFEVLEKDFDLPTVIVGVGGENGGFAHRFVSPIAVDEVGGVEIDGRAVEGGRNDEDGEVSFVGWEETLAPADGSRGLVRRGAQGGMCGGSRLHGVLDEVIGAEEVAM